MPNRLLDTSALVPQGRDAATRGFLETLTELDTADTPARLDPSGPSYEPGTCASSG